MNCVTTSPLPLRNTASRLCHDQPPKPLTAARVLLVFMGLFFTCFAFAAEAQTIDKSAATIAGRILDDQGRPVPGADVWMPLRWDEVPAKTPHATSDSNGSYILMVPRTWSAIPVNERQWIVWSHVRGRQIGMANAWHALFGNRESLNVTLGAATDTSFIVLGPDKKPLAGAMVEPYLVMAPNNCYLPPPKAIQQAIRATTDGTGCAALPAIGHVGFASVRITSASLGSQAIRLLDLGTSSGPTTPIAIAPAAPLVRREIRLRRAGRVEGRIEAARPEWTRGVKIYLSTTDALGFEGGLAEVITGDDGRFVVPAIAEGKLDVSPRLDPSLPVRPRPISDVLVQGDQTTKFVILLQKDTGAGSP
jgi:hypothetical protein